MIPIVDLASELKISPQALWAKLKQAQEAFPNDFTIKYKKPAGHKHDRSYLSDLDANRLRTYYGLRRKTTKRAVNP